MIGRRQILRLHLRWVGAGRRSIHSACGGVTTASQRRVIPLVNSALRRDQRRPVRKNRSFSGLVPSRWLPSVSAGGRRRRRADGVTSGVDRSTRACTTAAQLNAQDAASDSPLLSPPARPATVTDVVSGRDIERVRHRVARASARPRSAAAPAVHWRTGVISRRDRISHRRAGYRDLPTGSSWGSRWARSRSAVSAQVPQQACRPAFAGIRARSRSRPDARR